MSQILTIKKHWTSLITFVFVASVVAILTVLIMGQNEAWFNAITKPDFVPPHHVLVTLCATIYAFIAVSGWCVFIQPVKKSPTIRQHQKAIKEEQRLASFIPLKLLIPLTLLAINLVLSLVWTTLFFGLHALEWAFAEVLILWLCAFGVTLALFRTRVLAGILLLPYLSYVSFLLLLNFSIWRLNS